MLTNVSLYEFAVALQADGTFRPPDYIAVGLGTRPGGGSQDDTDLVMELHREKISSRVADTTGVARLAAVFSPRVAAGTWTELGLFYGNARVLVMSTCDSVIGWSSGNTLSADTNERREGSASLRSYGPNSLSFRTTALEFATDQTFTENDYFTFWYYVDDKSKLSSITVELGSTTNDDEHEYQWSVNPADLTNGWNFLRLQFSQATKVGSPNFNQLIRFRLLSTKSTSTEERIDWLRKWGHSGIMWARVEPTNPITKSPSESRVVYFYLQLLHYEG